MTNKMYTVLFFGALIGSTVCVIPEGEIQIGPVFGNAGRFFGNKHFEAVFDKGHLTPLLAKKALLGVGALGAGALAVGGAALLAKKLPHLHNHNGWGWGAQNNHAYGQYNNHYNTAPSYGWENSGGYYQTQADIKFPVSSYPSTQYGQGEYIPPSTDYGYPVQNEWQGSDTGSYEGAYGWSG